MFGYLDLIFLGYLTAVWIMVSGRRIAGAHTISGMELPEVQPRYILSGTSIYMTCSFL